MESNRLSGVLCHPTSLPGQGGIGTLGAQARAFVDWLHDAHQRIWQILPLGPTGYGDSPYACSSAFAGNPLLIDLEGLVERGYLSGETLAQAPISAASAVDFEAVKKHKFAALREVFQRFQAQAPELERAAFARFCRAPEQAFWLFDFALFSALKAAHDQEVWTKWPEGLRERNPADLERWYGQNHHEVTFYQFTQWIFALQWDALKAYATGKNITIMGDMPIFVAHDSADVWANPTLFHLDHRGQSTHVAGVPPDYFSETGQRWGNPLYRWDVMARDGYRWWLERFKTALRQVDCIRLDHFRGFAAFWAIPADEETAINGQWVTGPGNHFFDSMQRQLGKLPLIAEDLGTITNDVHELRNRFGLPGMKILQFAFSGPDNAYLPHNYDSPNCVVYTGTHDNDTTRGWWESLSEAERKRVEDYAPEGKSISWQLIKMALLSTASIALIPLQDILDLGSEARMNEPGRPENNWAWRYEDGVLTEALGQKLAHLTVISRRSQRQLQA